VTGGERRFLPDARTALQLLDEILRDVNDAVLELTRERERLNVRIEDAIRHLSVPAPADTAAVLRILRGEDES